jgi:carbon storage regulator CsrA
MFVLSRKSEESVIIDGFDSRKNALKVTVLEVAGGRVRLGFEVNSDSSAHRIEAVSRDHEPEVLLG